MVCQLLYEHVEDVLSSLDCMLRAKGNSEEGHILCVLVLLAVVVSIHQVSILDICFLSGISTAEDLRFDKEISVMEDQLFFMSMELFHRILTAAIDGGASDVHIKIGGPVFFRVNRRLVAIESPVPKAEWMNAVVEAILPKHARKRLEEEREVDFSYYIHGIGRFRTNVFQHGGKWALAMRHVKSQVPSFEQLGLAAICKELRLIQ